jgi:quinol monooxygenase YgiN
MIVIQGHIDVHPDDSSAFEALVVPMQQASNAEAGCVSYFFSRDLETPGRFRLAECWESEDALAAHFAAPHMATLQSGMGALRVTDVAVWKHTVSEHSRMR